MADIRKKFIDILFEPEEDEEETVVTKPEPKKEAEVKKEVQVEKPVAAVEEKKDRNTIQAKEIMYKNSSFANIELEKKDIPLKKAENDNYEYEALPNISPIFGVIDEKNAKTKEVVSKVDTNQTMKPESSYLGTVISPFYGYDEEKANEERMNILAKISKKKDDDLMDVTEELGDLFEDDYKEKTLERMLEEDTTYVVGNEIDLFADVFGEEKK